MICRIFSEKAGGDKSYFYLPYSYFVSYLPTCGLEGMVQ